MRTHFLSLLALALTSTAASAVAPLKQAASIDVWTAGEKGTARIEVMANEDNGDLVLVRYYPAKGRMVTATTAEITRSQGTNPPNGYPDQGGKTIKFSEKTPLRPAVTLVGKASELNAKDGGRMRIHYVVSGKGDPREWTFGDYAIRLDRGANGSWDIVPEGTSDPIRNLCFHKNTYWGFTVGVSSVEPNVTKCK
ncbi:MAG TPA: hypothetical protein VL588_08405 [Bdellovibrionota bacterium]|nr:hypothetical protein [Bdellovibrionota bacterium]